MDLSAFSNDNFDEKEWINNSYLQSAEAEADKEAFVSSMIVKLQLFIQEVSISLEDTAQQVIQYLPRVTREVEAMKQEAVLLHDQMRTIKQDIVKLERDSATSMQTLLMIDSMKSKMQDATRALKEADNWSTLSANVEEVFQKGNINEIADKLIGMQTSLDNLVDVPDYEERCLRLEGLKNQLEALLSPHLITAFNAKSLEATQMYARIFRDIKRLPQMLKYYQKCQKNHLIQSWRATIEADPEETLLDWLNTFYDTLLSTWHQQVTWCNQVLPEISTVPLVAELLVEVLTGLDPSLSFCLEAALKLNASYPISFLVKMKQITDGFARSLELAVQAHGPQGNQQLFTPHLTSLAQTLYAPLRGQLHGYANWQQRELEQQAPQLNLKDPDWQDTVVHLSDSVGKVFNLLCQAETQCQQLTNRSAYPALIRAVEAFYLWYLATFGQFCSDLCASQERKGRDPLDDDAWTTFQQALQTLQILGEVLLQIDSLETIFQSNLGETIKALGYPTSAPNSNSASNNNNNNNNTKTILLSLDQRSGDVNPFHAYDDLLLSPAGRKDLKVLMQKFWQDARHPLLEGARKEAHQVCCRVAQMAFDLVFGGISSRLQMLHSLQVWQDDHSEGTLVSDLPTFSLSPQGYITEIGQFLMTLPQHMEPFALQENPALLQAMAKANFPYAPAMDEAENVTEFLLIGLAKSTLEMFVEQALRIPTLTPHSTKQLLKDLGYLSDVLEDLGLTGCQSLNDLSDLLKASPAEFMTIARKKPIPMSNAIMNMRKLKM